MSRAGDRVEESIEASREFGTLDSGITPNDY